MSDVAKLALSIGRFINALVFPTNDPRSQPWLSDSVTSVPGDVSVETTTYMAAPAATQPMPSMLERARAQVAALQALDPDFIELQFLGQASAQYGAVLAGESAMDADRLSGIATPSFVECMRGKIQTWRDSGLRCIIRDVELDGSTVFKVTLDASTQSIVVRFTGKATRCTQDIETGEAVDGSLQPAYFTEFATFLRPAGTTTPKTVADGGATHCPSCGAPTVAGAPTCAYCGTQLTGTGSTWLLDKLSASAYT